MPWGTSRSQSGGLGGTTTTTPATGSSSTPKSGASDAGPSMIDRRQTYLYRLGIPVDGRPKMMPRPTGVKEAPACLETTKPKDEEDGDRVMEIEITNLRSSDDFRINYLRKVSQSQVWVPTVRRPPKHQTVIIFDWDDTLLCTSYLNMRADHPPPPNVERHLRGIEQASKDLVELALKLADHCFIITNAMDGWVEWSAAKYIPGIMPVLMKVKNNIISARGKYERAFPGDVSKWKLHAFLEVRKSLDSEIITNLISLGDSNFEMDAVHAMGEEFQESLIKTIKFRENPSPEELLKQLVLVFQKFEKIVENVRPLKIGLERKWVGAPKAAA